MKHEPRTVPHGRAFIDQAERAVVAAARALMDARIASTSTFPAPEVAALESAVAALTALEADNAEAIAEQRREALATEVHLCARPGDHRSLCGLDRPLQMEWSKPEFVERRQQAGGAYCPECLAAYQSLYA